MTEPAATEALEPLPRDESWARRWAPSVFATIGRSSS